MNYLLFAGKCYYARGGAHDLQSTHAKLDDAIAHGRSLFGTRPSEENDWAAPYIEWWHVYDVREGRIVAGTYEQAYGATDVKDGDR